MSAVAKSVVWDPTVYPETDDLGEHELQRLMAELLRPLLARFFAERGVVAHVGADQFIYWKQFEPTASIAPDIYVMPGIPQSRVGGSWKLWNEGTVPSFCLEIVSHDIWKDYRDVPIKCGEMGVNELVVYDPKTYAGEPPTGDRVTWQVFRRKRKTSPLECVLRSNGASVRSAELGFWLRVVGDDGARRLRIAHDVAGHHLYPTDAELAEAAEARAQAAEAQLERLRAELAKTTTKRRPRRT